MFRRCKTAPTAKRVMRKAHGHVSFCAVSDAALSCYLGAMKSHPYRNPAPHHDSGGPPTKARSASERGRHETTNAIPHRRYPSLSDDGQPYFPRLRRRVSRAEEEVPLANSHAGIDVSTYLSVRVIAVLVMLAIIALIVAIA